MRILLLVAAMGLQGCAVAAAGFEGYAQDRERARQRAVAAGTGEIELTADRRTCVGPLALEILVDSALAGTATIAPGKSVTLTVPAGNRRLSYRGTDRKETTPTAVLVPLADKLRLTITCK